MIVGTAGHIDHGKSSLIQRLTGRNTDLLPEEIKRGISIELGYAYVPIEGAPPGEDLLGFIDVPGHERFVHTMLAGATGVDFALLVIAADDGVMPQTDEHLDILLTLGVAHGAIALTKIDAVTPQRCEAVRAQIAARTAGGAAANWRVFALSSVSGEGVAALNAHLREQARTHRLREPRGHFRMAIDRAFTLAGVGTVVTGTVSHGLVRVGDHLALVPGLHGSPLSARVRSIHAQNRAAETGRAGQRCALNLAGLEKQQVERGMSVQSQELSNLTERIDVSLRLSKREAKALASTSVHFHHGTSDIMARLSVLDAASVEPGGEALVGLNLDRPLAVCQGDRFVIRDGAAQRTMGGGVVLDAAPLGEAPRRGRRAVARIAWLLTVREQPPVLALSAWLALQPLPRARLASVWNLTERELDALLATTEARDVAGFVFAREHWQRLREQALAEVAQAHAREPEMPGIDRQKLARIVAPGLAREAFAALTDELLAEQHLLRRGAFVALPTHTAELGRDQRVRWERIQPLLTEKRFEPPRVRDIARTIGVAEPEIRLLLKTVARVGDVMLVAHDHYFLTPAVAELADVAASVAQEHGVARAAEFRDRIGTGRKIAIQILEFFDRTGYTRRVRDDHLIRRSNPWRA